MKIVISVLLLFMSTSILNAQFDKLKFVYTASYVRNYEQNSWDKLKYPYFITIDFEKNVIELTMFPGPSIRSFRIVSPTITAKKLDGDKEKISKSWYTSRNQHPNPFAPEP
jgi:hypothetical protein